ncbi:MAG: ATP-grasp domain-containing protein [Gammaproteobacteria bacterium]|nr:ATP-grasp domain-containing protein [Gammaproteobacteria bacterium]
MHVVFVAPFFMSATLRFIKGAAELPGVRLSLVSQDPLDRLPPSLRARLSAHQQVPDGLNPAHIAIAIEKLASRTGQPERILATLEQAQVPVAQVREALGVAGLGVEASRNFRDKARMKSILRGAGIACARHRLAGDARTARDFVEQVGFPVVVKPPAGAGAKATFKLENIADFEKYIAAYPPNPANPGLLEEFMTGSEHSYESALLGGETCWSSWSAYMPSPLQVLENDWMQWCVLLPRSTAGDEHLAIAPSALAALRVLGLENGFSHLEWFRREDGSVAISEVGARPPGAQFMSLLSHAHDWDFYRGWAGLMALDEFAPPERKYACGAAYIRGQGRGPVKAIHGLDRAQARLGDLVVEAHLPKPGQAASDSYEGDGFVILRHPDTAVIRDALQELVSTVQVERAPAGH